MNRTGMHTVVALGFLALALIVLAGTLGLVGIASTHQSDTLRPGGPLPAQHLFASDVADRAAAPADPTLRQATGASRGLARRDTSAASLVVHSLTAPPSPHLLDSPLRI